MSTCVPNPLYEQFIAFLEMAQEQTQERIASLTAQRNWADREIQRTAEFAQFTQMLRRQVEDGAKPVEVALLELVPRNFNAHEFVGTLHEYTANRRRAS